MRVGLLRIPVRIEQPTVVRSQSGGHTKEWEPLEERASDWAEIRPLTGNELLRAQQITGQTTARIRLRYRDDLDETMRLVDLTKNATWEFRSAPLDPTGERLTVEIMASRG